MSTPLQDHWASIVQELTRTVFAIDAGQAAAFVDAERTASRIFLAGAGRTGFVIRAHAMRLMHLGRTVHVVGETTTPAIQAGELLVIGSGSGETSGLVAIAQRARKLQARIALVTIFPSSTLGHLADLAVRIPAPTPKVPAPGMPPSVQPMGTLFEQTLQVFLDSVIVALMDQLGTEAAAMFTRHANLE